MPSSQSADDTIIRDELGRCSLLLDEGANDEENGTVVHNIRAVTSTRFVDVDIIFVCRTMFTEIFFSPEIYVPLYFIHYVLKNRIEETSIYISTALVFYSY